MHPRTLRLALESDAVFGEFERRSYLGMSQIYRCPRVLYMSMVNGRVRPGLGGRRLCHEGLVHEADVIARLAAAGIEVSGQGHEVVAGFDPRFRGHVDGLIDGEVLEIKSVSQALFDAEVRRRALPPHVWQVQAYLRYGGWDWGQLVYKARDSGRVWVHAVRVDMLIGAQIEEKARRVLAAVDRGEPPACECGRCT